VGFRDTAGRIGLVDEFCPLVARLSGSDATRSLACAVSTTGGSTRCRQLCGQMNEPEPFCHKIHLKAYPPSRWEGSSGPHGPSRRECRHRHDSSGRGWRKPSPRLEGVGGVQLAPGPRRRHRHVPCPDPPSHHHGQDRATGNPSAGGVRREENRSWRSMSPTTATATPGFAPWAKIRPTVRAYHLRSCPSRKSGRNSSDAAGMGGTGP